MENDEQKNFMVADALKGIKRFFKRLKVRHYILFALILALGVFNAVTVLEPKIKQHQREKNIVDTFNVWWEETGKNQFLLVGLEPTEKIRQEEFETYREKYLQQNHTYIVEDRVKEMRQEFREWWEINGGKEAYIQEHNVYPDERHFEAEFKKWVTKYTNQFIRYRMRFVPADGNYESLLTCWMLFPSALSFILFFFLFVFAYLQLEKRWGFPIALGAFLLLAVSGGLFTSILTSTSFFHSYDATAYMGCSLVLAFFLGATAFGPRKLEISNLVKGISVFGLMADMAVNWFLNPGIFGAVALLSPILFGLGAVAGLKMPERRKTEDELAREALEERIKKNANRNPLAERKAKTRQLIDEGFDAAVKGALERAQRSLTQALSAMLQEHPVDEPAVKNLIHRMTSPELYIEIPSTQWFEWGEIAKAKNSPEAAVMLLKKGLSSELDANFARRALYTLGEVCVNNNIEREDGLRRLHKVIEMNGNDILAIQARKTLEAAGEK